MTTTEEQLIAAIRLNLADDGPRLIYADWQIDRGDRQGEIIQLQIQRPRRKAHVAKLIAALPRPDWAGEWPPNYVRGFATTIVVRDGNTLVKHIAAIRSAHPLAELALANGVAVAVSSDERWIATILYHEDAAGNQATGTSWTTTTAIVFDGVGQTVYQEARTYSQSYSGSGDSEDGETISSVAFSPDGRQLVLHISDGTTVTRALPE